MPVGDKRGLQMAKVTDSQPLSPQLREIWGFVSYRYLILATLNFIVFIDNELDVDWKTTTKYDEDNKQNAIHWARIVDRAAILEGADRDNSRTYFRQKKVLRETFTVDERHCRLRGAIECAGIKSV